MVAFQVYYKPAPAAPEPQVYYKPAAAAPKAQPTVYYRNGRY